jgi:hypothetical protein
VGALALPMTLTTAMKVAFGSKWLVALRRAQAAGKMLAMQLVQVGPRKECWSSVGSCRSAPETPVAQTRL